MSPFDLDSEVEPIMDRLAPAVLPVYVKMLCADHRAATALYWPTHISGQLFDVRSHPLGTMRDMA